MCNGKSRTGFFILKMVWALGLQKPCPTHLTSKNTSENVVTLSPLLIRKRSPHKLTIFWPNCCGESTRSAADTDTINKPTPDTDKIVAIPSARTPSANPLRMLLNC
ncbi:hypothetical protein WUBG_08616 [Wuchereria bancrofti]|uniref:Uncharacterized protein n=1 Tax=Wuchereria bancrofti TaxID=6293 RepID=J9EDD2_WUCBA|nr:hypothetical protein WUBG_08616 [Wuchereria bancrofti]